MKIYNKKWLEFKMHWIQHRYAKHVLQYLHLTSFKKTTRVALTVI